MPLIRNLLVSLRDRRECIIWGCPHQGIVYFPGLTEFFEKDCLTGEAPSEHEYWECIFHYGVGWYLWGLCCDMVRWTKRLIA